MKANGRAPLCIGLCIALAGCGAGSGSRASAGGPSPTPAASATPAAPIPAVPSVRPSPTPPPPATPIRLPVLPETGFVVGDDKGVTFVDAGGVVVHRIAHVRLAGNPGSRGLWFSRGRRYYELQIGKRRLRPVGRRVARDKMYDEVPPSTRIPPPPGARVNGLIAGHWRFAFEAPDGGALLAQWSGECEVPIAYYVYPGAPPRIVTGELGIRGAQESFALGWVGGLAAVQLPRPGCAGSGGAPGIYLFSSPGAGELLYRTKGYASAEMWGPGAL